MTHGPHSSACWALSRLLETIPRWAVDRRTVLRLAMDALRRKTLGRQFLAVDLIASDCPWPAETPTREALPGLFQALEGVVAPDDIANVKKAVLWQGAAFPRALKVANTWPGAA